MWRNRYEFTDDYGITRSTTTNNEILFRRSEMRLGESTLFINAAFSLDANGRVVVDDWRSRAYSISGGMGTSINVTGADFVTDGCNISFLVNYSTTLNPIMIFGFPFWLRSREGNVTGTFFNLGSCTTFHIFGDCPE